VRGATKNPPRSRSKLSHAPDAVDANIEGKARLQKIFYTAFVIPSGVEESLIEMQKNFELLATDRHSKARRGRLTSAHGEIDTPAFMPVGTQGSVKGVSPRELRELNAQIVLEIRIIYSLGRDSM
jgi:hypothetical protein